MDFIGVNVRTFPDLPTSFEISDMEAYVNGKYKISGTALLLKIVGGMGIRKVVQAPQVYSGTDTVVCLIDVFVGEDYEVFRNGVLVESGLSYNVGANNRIVSFVFATALDGDSVQIVKREIFSRI